MVWYYLGRFGHWVDLASRVQAIMRSRTMGTQSSTQVSATLTLVRRKCRSQSLARRYRLSRLGGPPLSDRRVDDRAADEA